MSTTSPARKLGLVAATGVVLLRELRPTLRNPVAIISGLTQPILYVLLFGPLLTNMAIPGISGGNSWNWFVPGMLVFTTLFSTAFAGADIQYDRDSGTLERLLASPVNRFALLLGQVGRQLTMLLVQAAVLIVLVLPFGFSASPLGALAGIALLVVMAAGVGIGSLALGLAIKQIYVFYTVVQTAVLPVMLTAGMLLPMNAAPDWLYTLSRINPLTHIVDAERALFMGDFSNPAILIAVAISVVGGALATMAALRAIRKMSA